MNDSRRCSLLLLSGTGVAKRFKRSAICCGIDELRGNMKKSFLHSMNRFGLKKKLRTARHPETSNSSYTQRTLNESHSVR
jgi:hypothetical protein